MTSFGVSIITLNLFYTFCTVYAELWVFANNPDSLPQLLKVHLVIEELHKSFRKKNFS